MTLAIAKITPASLDEVVENKGLQLNEADEIKGAYLPFLEQFQEIAEQAVKINTENPTDVDEKIARELRLKTVKVRKGAEALKEDRKKIYLLKGNLEQSSFNVIKNTCLLAEDAFEQVEKAREIAEKKRQEELKEARTIELSEFTDSAAIYPLGIMSEDAYKDLLNGFKLKREADLKAEQDRLEALRLEEERKAKEAEAMREENERLKKEAEKKEQELAAERKRLEEERIANEKKIAEEKRIADEAAAKLKAEQDAIIKAEKDKADALAAQLKAKEDAEIAAKKAADEAEKKRIADEKKAAKAPDKDKLKTWVNSFIMTYPNVKSEEAKAIADEVMAKFQGFNKWANEQIEKL